MLAIQCVRMYWRKDNRNPAGAVMRRDYIKPTRIDSCIKLDSKDGNCFLQKRSYIQKESIYEGDDYNKGVYLSNLFDIKVPGIEVFYDDESYVVKWHSLENGYQPVRTGYNEDFNNPQSICMGKRIKNVTAFTLSKGEAGRLQYNYRYTSDYGQHYEQFTIYILHTDKLEHNSFVKATYSKQYDEMEDFFRNEKCS